MALIREITGNVDENGRPIYNYRQEPLDASKPVIYTGPHIKGSVTTSDGTVVNVSDDYVEVDSHEVAGEVSHHVGLLHEEEGHPAHLSRNHPDYNPLQDEFIHVCNDSCGAAARSGEEAEAAFNQRLESLGHADQIGTELHHQRLEHLAGAHRRISAAKAKGDQ